MIASLSKGNLLDVLQEGPNEVLILPNSLTLMPVYTCIVFNCWFEFW